MSATLKNTQTVPLGITSIAISGGSALGDFVGGGNCPLLPSTLGPGENCRITVTFTPSGPGMRTASLTVTDNARTSPLTILLTGMGVAPEDLTPSNGNLGAVALGNTSARPSGTRRKILSRGRPGTFPGRVSGGPILVPVSGAGNADGLISITVTPANPSIAAGNTQQFTATGIYSNGSTQNLTASVLWSSSVPGVATINAAGLASSISPGSTIITAAYVTSPPGGVAPGVAPRTPIVVSPPVSSGITGSTTLTVTAPTLVSMAVTPANPSIAAGQTQQFTATGTYSNGSTQNLTSTATWSSSATGVATMSTTGLASALGVGQTTIAAASGAINGSTTLTVTAGFVLTGSLNTARYFHTATLLNNGMVLMVGGSGPGGGAIASTELYNPATGTFTLAGSPNIARRFHSATLLNNGLVLIAGGIGSSGYLTSAELYNPTTGTFTPTGSLNTARGLHTATLLNNGTVLMAGGYSSSSSSLASAELYDPATGTFTPTGSMNSARGGHTATLDRKSVV
jgi:hypothetical protein